MLSSSSSNPKSSRPLRVALLTFRRPPAVEKEGRRDRLMRCRLGYGIEGEGESAGDEGPPKTSEGVGRDGREIRVGGVAVIAAWSGRLVSEKMERR